MPRYKLVIAYDGTAYGGWQSQTNSCCIQDMIQGALSTILRSKTVICGSGRTDAGVHATGQVAHFDTERDIDPGKIGYSLNCLLPKDIRIVDIKPVKDSFHAKMPAELAILRSFDNSRPGVNAASVLLNKSICRSVVASCLSSALARCVINLMGCLTIEHCFNR